MGSITLNLCSEDRQTKKADLVLTAEDYDVTIYKETTSFFVPDIIASIKNPLVDRYSMFAADEMVSADTYTEFTSSSSAGHYIITGSQKRSSVTIPWHGSPTTINASSLFSSTNKNERTVRRPYIILRRQDSSEDSAFSCMTSWLLTSTKYKAYSEGGTPTEDTPLNFINITLDAPPTFTASDVSFSTPNTSVTNVAYAGYTTASVSVSDLSAKYGGDIVSCELKIGNQTASRATDGVLSILLNAAGEFTPAVTVTDSRGQMTTQSLSNITVAQYVNPTVSFSVQRIDKTTLKVSDDGTNALITGTFAYLDILSCLAQPTVQVSEAGGSTKYDAVVTWYEEYSDGAFSNPVSWANYKPSSPKVLYGKVTGYTKGGSTTEFDTQYAYTVYVVGKDSRNVSSVEIAQTLTVAFYTVDFLAGGKGIAFGKASTADGFEVDMDMTLQKPVIMNDDVEANAEVTMNNVIYIGLPDYQTSGSDDKNLYDAIVALGWQDVLES